MRLYFFVVLLLCDIVFCDNCVTFNFEEGFKDYFTDNYGMCAGMSTWNIGKYSILNIESPHDGSTSFISPLPTLSCVSSFKFNITAGGRLEVNLFMSPVSTADIIAVAVSQSNIGGNDPNVGYAALSALDPNFVPGWQIIAVNIIGLGNFEGYITFMGTAAAASYLLIDSFRYISPSFDEELCMIYPEDDRTTLASPTSTEKLISTTETYTTTITTEQPTTATEQFITTTYIDVPSIMTNTEPSPIITTTDLSTVTSTDEPAITTITTDLPDTKLPIITSTTELPAVSTTDEPFTILTVTELPTTTFTTKPPITTDITAETITNPTADGPITNEMTPVITTTPVPKTTAFQHSSATTTTDSESPTFIPTTTELPFQTSAITPSTLTTISETVASTTSSPSSTSKIKSLTIFLMKLKMTFQ